MVNVEGLTIGKRKRKCHMCDGSIKRGELHFHACNPERWRVNLCENCISKLFVGLAHSKAKKEGYI